MHCVMTGVFAVAYLCLFTLTPVAGEEESGQSVAKNPGKIEYRLLATSKTSTMQKELQEAADNGFEYAGQTVFETTFGGEEVVVILEREKGKEPIFYEYKLLATTKTGTMQKELTEAGSKGFEFVGLTVSSTTFGGDEVVSILRRERAP